MARLIAAIGALVMAWLGILGPSFASAPSSNSSATAHTYDRHQHDSSIAHARTDRGPPAMYDATAAESAAGDPSSGPSARPRAATTSAAFAYDHAALVVQVATVADTPEWREPAAQAPVSSHLQSDVAANAVTRAPQVLRVGELKLTAVPKGAVGTPTTTGKGLEYAIPRGTPEISERVASIRIMDPVTTGKHVYPNGYAVYMNAQGQRVNPLTGQMIHDLSDPFAHIPLP